MTRATDRHDDRLEDLSRLLSRVCFVPSHLLEAEIYEALRLGFRREHQAVSPGVLLLLAIAAALIGLVVFLLWRVLLGL
ncbi:MAG TPA: hypothetical protein VH879_02600 [Gemmatimonadales bacterium]|jgi:hypothetical protein